MPHASQAQSVYVAKYWECREEVRGRCVRWRTYEVVRFPGLTIEVFEGEKFRQCLESRTPGMRLCVEGQVILNNRIVDGNFATAVKVHAEGLSEGWHDASEGLIQQLLGSARWVLSQLEKPAKTRA